MFGRHLTVPVVRIGDVADQRVHIVLLKHIRAGADWPGVHIFRCPLFQHRVRVLGREDRGEVHSPVGQERRVGFAQRELDVIIVDLFHILNELVEAHVIKVFVITLGNIVIGMLRVFLTHNGENNVISVKITGRFEVFIAVEFYPFTQGKCVCFAVWRNGPRLGQRRHRRVFYRVEVNQTVIQRLRAGDKRRSRAGDLRVKRLRRRLGAVDNGVFICRPCGACR